MNLSLGRLRQVQSKNYLANIEKGIQFTFTELIIMLFSTYKKGTKDWDEIKSLLIFLGIDNLSKIEKQDLPIIKKWIIENTHALKLEEDAEYLAYKLLSAITSKDILVYIDHHLIENVDEKVNVKYTSVISFIDKIQINQLKFTTI